MVDVPISPPGLRLASRPARAAVIGTGQIAEQHLGFLASSDRCSLAAVADLSRARGEFAAARYGLETWFSDHHAMLETERPEVVHVLTPARSHLELIRDCLRADAHVVAEKPITLSRADFVELDDEAKARGLILVENHNYRFNRVVEQLTELAGRLGQIIEVDVRWALPIRDPGGAFSDRNLVHPSHSLPGGAIHEFITHCAYLGLMFCDPHAPIELVGVHWGNYGSEGADDPFRHDELDALVRAGDAHVRLRFSSRTQPSELVLTVRGEYGAAAANLYESTLTVTEGKRRGRLDDYLGLIKRGASLQKGGLVLLGRRLFHLSPYEGIGRFLDSFYGSVQGEGPPPVFSAEIERSLQLIDLLIGAQT